MCVRNVGEPSPFPVLHPWTGQRPSWPGCHEADRAQSVSSFCTHNYELSCAAERVHVILFNKLHKRHQAKARVCSNSMLSRRS